jgi:hypothetical protein
LSDLRRGHKPKQAVRDKAIAMSVAMRVDSELRDLDRLLSKYTSMADASLTFIEYDGLCIEDAPAIAHMRIDAPRTGFDGADRCALDGPVDENAARDRA